MMWWFVARGAPEGTVLFIILSSTQQTDSCQLQKFSYDAAMVRCVSEGNKRETVGGSSVITDFVSWCAGKTKEMVIDFRRNHTGEHPGVAY